MSGPWQAVMGPICRDAQLMPSTARYRRADWVGADIIVLGASDILFCTLIIIFVQHSILFVQMHTSVAVGVMILDAADKLVCVIIIIFDLE